MSNFPQKKNSHAVDTHVTCCRHLQCNKRLSPSFAHDSIPHPISSTIHMNARECTAKENRFPFFCYFVCVRFSYRGECGTLIQLFPHNFTSRNTECARKRAHNSRRVSHCWMYSLLAYICWPAITQVRPMYQQPTINSALVKMFAFSRNLCPSSDWKQRK